MLPARARANVKWFSERVKPGKPRRGRLSPMQRLSLRLVDLAKVYRHRYGVTLPDDDAGRADLEVALNHLACLPHPTAPMRQWAKLWCPWLPIAEYDATAAQIVIEPKRWDADSLARELGLEWEERQMLGITTIGAIDMNKAQRNKRRKHRAKIRCAGIRAKTGSKPRAQYEAQSLSRTKPWLDEGVSRATWYRRKRETTAGRETTPNTA